MVDYVPVEKGMTTRQPSTANLMISSLDRNIVVYPNPFDFQITKQASILNGFFTRIGVTEVCLDWCVHNLDDANGTNSLTVDLSGNPGTVITLPTGNYTVEEALDMLVVVLNEETPTTNQVFSINSSVTPILISVDVGQFQFLQTNQGDLADKLDIEMDAPANFKYVMCPNLQPFSYIDFVSNQLTYAQDLKDASTNEYDRDVLCRWYFAEDVQETYDGYGFPILMGYKRFFRRRIFSPPKQIRWEPNLPIGNLSFQVFTDQKEIIQNSDTEQTAWYMTLQVSEV
jgi:hypothetical protein